MAKLQTTLLAVAATLGLAGGCADLVGYRATVYLEVTGEGGEGGTATTSTSGGGGGTGGAGGCLPGETRSCYTGPDGTESIGVCQSGTETCKEDGVTWNPCSGQVLPSEEKPEVPGDEACDGFAPGEALWTKRWGDGSSQAAFAIATGKDETVAVGGSFGGSFDFPVPLISSGSDGWVARLDAKGNVLWANAFGDANSQAVSAVAITSIGEVFVGGMFQGTIQLGDDTLDAGAGVSAFVAKFDPGGGYLWSRRLASDGFFLSQPLGLALTPSEDLVVAGSFSGAIDLGGSQLTGLGALDMFVCELASGSGSLAWSKKFVGAGDQLVLKTAVDLGGNIVVGGLTSGSFSVNFNDVNVAAGATATFILRLDEEGSPDWMKGLGGQGGTQTTMDLALDSLGNVYTAGIFEGTMVVGDTTLTSASVDNIFFAQISPAGKINWGRRFGEVSFDALESVSLAAHSDGSTRLSIHAVGDIDFGGGVLEGTKDDKSGSDFLAAFDVAGNHAWSRVFPDFYKEGACYVAIAGNEDTLMACGAQAAVIDYGAEVLDGKGAQDLTITRFAP